MRYFVFWLKKTFAAAYFQISFCLRPNESIQSVSDGMANEDAPHGIGKTIWNCHHFYFAVFAMESIVI